MDKRGTEALMNFTNQLVESIEEINKGLNDLTEIVFKHADNNMESRKQMTNLIIQLGEATDVLTKEEVNKLKEI
tara:strand:+ start:158 stop:379 length:222 start_codon:yes stop_codon:yes gene_type:complete